MNETTTQLTEVLRQRVVDDLFEMSSFSRLYPDWLKFIHEKHDLSDPTAAEILRVGESLYDVFFSTAIGRGQSAVATAGAAFEGLICWYLNLCMVNTPCVVIKKSSALPGPIKDALTVLYGSHPSNSESDLVAVTFSEAACNATGTERELSNLDSITSDNFAETEVCVIQCKTNWRDNAQVPMLWNLIYSSTGFAGIASVGTHGWNVRSLQRFAYAFATVPTGSGEHSPTAMHVQRVKNITGSNFWLKPTEFGVALNISEMLNKNFSNALHRCNPDWHRQQSDTYKTISSTHPYFKFP